MSGSEKPEVIEAALEGVETASSNAKSWFKISPFGTLSVLLKSIGIVRKKYATGSSSFVLWSRGDEVRLRSGSDSCRENAATLEST